MYGWNGRILRVNLSKGRTTTYEYTSDIALNFLGGRGFAIKILWDELNVGVNPFSPENMVILATGPLTGLPLPSSGKLVLATKSPLTGSYGDGNIGGRAAVHLRKAGYDAVVLEGSASKPSLLWIDDDRVEILDAGDLWSLGAFKAEKELRDKFGGKVGVLLIGPAGENLVKYATVISENGRSGGRPGIGAVMGSKRLKAVVIRGSKNIPVFDPDGVKALGAEGRRVILDKPEYGFWMRQGTMSTIEWSQENSVLPTFNFKEGVFEEAETIGGFAMEKIKKSQKGCPNCNMLCGNVVQDLDELSSELDYESVAMLGSNVGLGDLKEIASLNRLADDYGIDTISLGNVIGFAMEASEKKLIDEKIDWGDFVRVRELVEDVVYRRGIGAILAEGTRRAAERLGGDTSRWAMNVKGLEISAYDCHLAPGMALAFATSPIGAHHKDAWVISWEIQVGRQSYSEAKVDKIIELQRIRGGLFESLVTCRFPWIELGLSLEWYPKFLKVATGVDFQMEKLFKIADRIYNLIRAFWVREYQIKWGSIMDYPPSRWFDEPLTVGLCKGATLKRDGYERLLQEYYRKRGWDHRGIPAEATLKELGLAEVAKELKCYVKLKAT